jgi:ribonuclease HI
MNEIMLFSDGSVNTKSKTGYGACLVVSDIELSLEILRNNVKIKRFGQTSSTKLELQTLLWALDAIKNFEGRIIIYTDSQNIIRLPQKREQLESSNYYSKKNKRLNNFELYQEFYRITDKLNCEVIKVRGHQKSKEKDNIDNLFTLVDRASRKALRTHNKELLNTKELQDETI